MQFSRVSTSFGRLSAATAALLSPVVAFAQDAAAPAAEAVAAAPVPDKGDTAFMFLCTILVLFMLMPGLGLFYGGLVRAKNMLSVLMQCTVVGASMMLVWVIYGYSFAFGGSENAYFGGTAKLFLSGITMDSTAATFSDAVIPEYIFMLFQMTFAALTPALIVGAFAERIKFSAALLFCILWATFVYFPVAHMVWDANGLLFAMGALDFAGGTVVHINAGVAGLIGAIMIGKRTGFGKDMMAPHSMTLTLVGAAMLWVGWFGFNAGSNLEASGGAMLATVNTFIATAAAIVSWCIVESFTRGKASMLGAASGMIAGLVAITPAAGIAGPMGAIVMGLLVSPLCYFFIAVIKNKFGYDDTADVFGVHGVGGFFGALATGIFASSSLGGIGYADGVTMGGQFMTQLTAVVITIVWCGIVSAILYKVVDVVVGLRVPVEAEREGLDLASHGEAAYHS
ncbi:MULTISPECIES: ammonium transporter [Pseudorhizobium]|uniref:Ammonium transporter n=1 Tax=Pseudorhizobium pelagicum TaxID=1509405 RepID=A0A922P4Z2_9HYPH|nr:MULTISPECIES: ammonium transporter [Pseudorhizobium]MBU1316096.1 ammonium transporter [Alphaproteobacteria bacterium]KEQ07035.1 ammonia channel protein [Pseudorhizobium pelagicum]KEQ09980.1 ammonia channel protein [Pseudorhizobium pelagicum]MBU1549844.1 ammonium transporter [Alphaproteobacteria bacterium]MBU2336700.1 ammonium transporter [Alphaproteobacteria bacterium]|tara:strand:- start:2983 stop:4344 length:1362 start_codon:yes stop_codon:yes gene_type:complete